MKVIEAEARLSENLDRQEILEKLERIGRLAYRSENSITESSASDFVRRIIAKGHTGVLEHVTLTIRFICDRGVSHELVRHRLTSIVQESTRYCNYSLNKFGNELTFIKPFWFDGSVALQAPEAEAIWREQMWAAERAYLRLLKLGWLPQEARSVLPNSLKTELLVTANLREWLHIFNLRCSKDAHPQMREIMRPLQKALQELLPEVFISTNLAHQLAV